MKKKTGSSPADLILGFMSEVYSQEQVIDLTDNNEGRIFEGIGALECRSFL